MAIVAGKTNLGLKLVTQAWISQLAESQKKQSSWLQKALEAGESTSIAYHGNIVDLLEYVNENNIHVDLLSDQTATMSMTGGYCPAGISFEERINLLAEDRKALLSWLTKRTTLQGNQGAS